MIILKRCFFIFFWLLLMWLVCASSWAETIRLMNGRIFDGEIAAESGDEVKIIMKSGIVTFSRDEIDSIGERKISPPAPVKKPVAKKTTKSVPGVAKPAAKKQQQSVKKIKKQVVPQKKIVKTESVPTVTADTATVTTLSPSTETVTSVSSAPLSAPAALPARSQKRLSPSAKAAGVTMAIAIIALIVLLLKRMKK
ncbi:MAG: hypothetical protein HY920_02825 [Elusimicrobia bacterium]|nr:hypothetical protein [Elusimicrobiota bacterium]